MKAIEVSEYGDTGSMQVVEEDVPEPGPGQVRIEVEAAGINFADIMQRRGHYPGGPEAPFRPGFEAAGTIEAVGEGVAYEGGERVVGLVGVGGYAEYAVTDAESLFPIPEGMSFAEAAGFPVQFLTAHNCLFGWGGLEEGESVLIQAAAGGVGTAAVQLADRAGAEVFGTASTQEKLDLAADLGCDHPINYTEADFREVVLEETDGEGVDLALDGVGDEVFAESVRATKDFGRIVPYGAASGVPGTLDTSEMFFRNQSVIGYHLGKAMQQKPQRVLEAVPDLTQGLESGELEVIVGETFALEDAAEAHEYIEARKSSGKVVLEP
ncbi:NADPH:quinone oxidoreductase family protein [Haloarchaeobius sp. HME9146]|uniref:quinone oxidoreductase family protein n=1 Tax=Haloarchaeobius sp. HME9146 TaxID=2978732 RepID=UPI0021BE5391|nr:NADPH:quinone oxidoreductase family protein [Haloarchaeobius sp. HME9146]MCT9097266.1 NADPH:quinone oxidoreductase family protein [Haloarchaeobius sp. HME9146]